MTCLACKKRGKDWDGDDPKCAFPNGGEFTPGNWNCATANLIRDLCGKSGDDRHPAVDWRGHNSYWDSGDQKYASIELPDPVELPTEGSSPLALWVSWYKHRGCTEAMWLLSEEGEPRRPTEADCIAIIETLTEVEAWWREQKLARERHTMGQS